MDVCVNSMHIFILDGFVGCRLAPESMILCTGPVEIALDPKKHVMVVCSSFLGFWFSAFWTSAQSNPILPDMFPQISESRLHKLFGLYLQPISQLLLCGRESPLFRYHGFPRVLVKSRTYRFIGTKIDIFRPVRLGELWLSILRTCQFFDSGQNLNKK